MLNGSLIRLLYKDLAREQEAAKPQDTNKTPPSGFPLQSPTDWAGRPETVSGPQGIYHEVIMQETGAFAFDKQRKRRSEKVDINPQATGTKKEPVTVRPP